METSTILSLKWRGEEVTSPCFLVDMGVVRRNCRAMRERCEKLGVRLRAMMKTHKTREIACEMTGPSKTCISASTVKEAEFFADAGFNDILFASMVTHDKIKRIQEVAKRVSIFHVVVDNDSHVSLLKENPLLDGAKWSAYLKVNTGHNRAGVHWDSEHALLLARQLHSASDIHFQGLYVHDGNSYACRGEQDLIEAGQEAVERVNALATRLRYEGIEFADVGIGSTPTCNVPCETMSLLTELHPGNYVFNDVMQVIVGSCQPKDIAVKVATRVKGQFPDRNQLLVDAGFVAMSFDGYSAFDKELDGSFCWVENEPNLRLEKMSQEVGYITSKNGQIDFDKHPIGSIIYLLPYHSCATACQFTEFYAIDDGKIVDVYTPCKGW